MTDDVLLDTHTLLWWFAQALPAGVRKKIRVAPRAVVSAATIWEAEIKSAVGKLRLLTDLLGRTTMARFELLPMTGHHAVRAARLPLHHRDPFDRMLVAQALEERLVLLSAEAQLDRYGVARVWS